MGSPDDLVKGGNFRAETMPQIGECVGNHSCTAVLPCVRTEMQFHRRHLWTQSFTRGRNNAASAAGTYRNPA